MKKFLSALCSVMLIVSLLPSSVFAQEVRATPSDHGSVTVGGYTYYFSTYVQTLNGWATGSSSGPEVMNITLYGITQSGIWVENRGSGQGSLRVDVYPPNFGDNMPPENFLDYTRAYCNANKRAVSLTAEP